jgi:hypothetical protein
MTGVSEATAFNDDTIPERIPCSRKVHLELTNSGIHANVFI